MYKPICAAIIFSCILHLTGASPFTSQSHELSHAGKSSTSTLSTANTSRIAFLKRDLEPLETVDDVNCYIDRVVNKEDNVEPYAPEDDPNSSAVWKSFDNQPFQIGSKCAILEEPAVCASHLSQNQDDEHAAIINSDGDYGLVGCTTVTIISRQGVWMAHFWEINAFSGNKDNHEDGDLVYDEDDFQGQVVNFISNEQTTVGTARRTLTSLRAELADASVYVVHPGRGKGVQYKAVANYRKKLNRMKTLFGQKIQNMKWNEIFYERPERDEDREYEKVIQVLFEYDPSPQRVRLMVTDQEVLAEGQPGQL